MTYRRRQRSKRHEAAHAESSDVVAPLQHPLVSKDEPRLVETQEALDEALRHVRDHESFAFDTEFIGEVAYLPKTCLIQLATPERVHLVDPLAVPDVSAIWELVGDPARTTIVHAGASDLSPVRRHLGRAPENLVDVQVAAAFAGMPYPASLGKLVERFAGHPLAKGHTFTDWDARPLTPSQLRYAADDVRYLPLLWNELRTALDAAGRLDWARRESLHRLDDPHVFDPQAQARRASRGYELDAEQEALLTALCVERDRIAREENLPNRATIPDGALLECVRIRPETKPALVAVRGMPRPIVTRHGDRLLATIAAHPSRRVEWFRIRRRREDEPDIKARIDAALAAAHARCEALGVPSSIAVTRADLERCARRRLACIERGEPIPPVFAPDDWRCEAFADLLDRHLT